MATSLSSIFHKETRERLKFLRFLQGRKRDEKILQELFVHIRHDSTLKNEAKDSKFVLLLPEEIASDKLKLLSSCVAASGLPLQDLQMIKVVRGDSVNSETAVVLSFLSIQTAQGGSKLEVGFFYQVGLWISLQPEQAEIAAEIISKEEVCHIHETQPKAFYEALIKIKEQQQTWRREQVDLAPVQASRLSVFSQG